MNEKHALIRSRRLRLRKQRAYEELARWLETYVQSQTNQGRLACGQRIAGIAFEQYGQLTIYAEPLEALQALVNQEYTHWELVRAFGSLV